MLWTAGPRFLLTLPKILYLGLSGKQKECGKQWTLHLESILKSLDIFQFPLLRLKKPLNPIALRTAKTLWSFGHSECNRVEAVVWPCSTQFVLAFLSVKYTQKLGHLSISSFAFKKTLNPIALRTAKIQWIFGRSECNRIEAAVRPCSTQFVLAFLSSLLSILSLNMYEVIWIENELHLQLSNYRTAFFKNSTYLCICWLFDLLLL